MLFRVLGVEDVAASVATFFPPMLMLIDLAGAAVLLALVVSAGFLAPREMTFRGSFDFGTGAEPPPPPPMLKLTVLAGPAGFCSLADGPEDC